MVMKLTATEAKAKFLALLDEVESGDEIEITRRGRTIARITPARAPHALRGKYAGIVTQQCEDEELFSTGEAWNAM
jgi:prevent-host-death family protein